MRISSKINQKKTASLADEETEKKQSETTVAQSSMQLKKIFEG